ncbi:MAG: RIP metalloprotease RseP [Bacteroidota bacterium]
MEALIMTAQILLCLSILVGLHELGHLLAAKFFGMRVEQYSIGFPPKIFSFKYGETEYSLSAIPLGGFVKISGMIDESLDKSFQDEEPKDYEFRSKPAWQRLIVMLGGIIVNVILGILIFIMMTYSYGDQYIPKKVVLDHGIRAYDIGEDLGLKTGDRIIAVNGHDYEKFNDLVNPNEVFLEDGSYYTVLRDDEELTIEIPSDFLDRISDREAFANFMSPRMPFKVGDILEGSPAAEAGLQTGDEIISIDGKAVSYYDEFIEYRDAKGEESFGLVVLRDGSEVNLDMSLNDDGIMGFNAIPQWSFATSDYSFSKSISLGTTRAFSVVWLNIKAFGKMFSGDISPQKSLSGPIGIATLFGGYWDWQNFWRLTGMLSMVLAFMNFLPIPALDGGHVTFLTWEIISGRKPSDKFLEGAQKVGMVLILSLMVFVIGNDILKLF